MENDRLYPALATGFKAAVRVNLRHCCKAAIGYRPLGHLEYVVYLLATPLPHRMGQRPWLCPKQRHQCIILLTKCATQSSLFSANLQTGSRQSTSSLRSADSRLLNTKGTSSDKAPLPTTPGKDFANTGVQRRSYRRGGGLHSSIPSVKYRGYKQRCKRQLSVKQRHRDKTVGIHSQNFAGFP